MQKCGSPFLSAFLCEHTVQLYDNVLKVIIMRTTYSHITRCHSTSYRKLPLTGLNASVLLIVDGHWWHTSHLNYYVVHEPLLLLFILLPLCLYATMLTLIVVPVFPMLSTSRWVDFPSVLIRYVNYFS